MKSPVETPAAVDWSRARALLADLKSAVRRSLAAQVLLGKELDFLKKTLGYAGKGSNRGPEGQFVVTVKSWNQWCQDEMGVTSRTADRWIHCFESAVERAKRHKKTQPQALRLLQMPAAEMDGGEIEALAACVDRLVDDSTQRELLFEIGILKDTRLTGGDTPRSNKSAEETLSEAWAVVFFAGIRRKLDEVKREIFRNRDGVDYRFKLKALPLTPDPDDQERPCLQGIKRTLEEVLQGDLVKVIQDVEAEIEERGKAADAITPRPRKKPAKSKR
jgi:hypothetical protein